jgi:glycosyltransferase involved in cell wall biosynthesis
MVLPVAAYPLGPSRFAVESAFADHLRLLLRMHKPRFTTMTLAGPIMPATTYRERGSFLGELDATTDQIRFVGLHNADANDLAFAAALPNTIKRLHAVVNEADLVLSGTSHNLRRPLEFYALMLASRLGKKTISVSDIDLREEARMLHETGRWSRRSLVSNQLLHNPVRHWQQKKVVEKCSLVLVKGQKLVDDYGKGADHVKFFEDTAYSVDQVVSEAELTRRCEDVARSSEPLRLVHFGRLEFYKGIHHAIEALAIANGGGSEVAELTVIGTGSEEGSLRELAHARGVSGAVHFCPPMSYGDEFLDRVRTRDMMIAPVLAPDTPRSAWDAIASGLPILAYDTEYYAQLRDKTGAVATVPWGDIEALAHAIGSFAEDRNRIVQMKRATHRPAIQNSQERWLERRVAWTEGLFANGV